MSQLEKSLQTIETGRYLLNWIASRADILFFAYQCLDFVTSAHEPLERTSCILESLLPEFTPESPENEENVVEDQGNNIVFRSMQISSKYLILIKYLQ